jgi:hypothetical protein
MWRDIVLLRRATFPDATIRFNPVRLLGMRAVVMRGEVRLSTNTLSCFFHHDAAFPNDSNIPRIFFRIPHGAASRSDEMRSTRDGNPSQFQPIRFGTGMLLQRD